MCLLVLRDLDESHQGHLDHHYLKMTLSCERAQGALIPRNTKVGSSSPRQATAEHIYRILCKKITLNQYDFEHSN